MFGHVTGHMMSHVGESSSSLFGYSLALEADLVDLGVLHLIPS